MNTEKGSLSINSENMFPIIKKWLYSDHDIFYRELISNGCDAITKLKKLALIGEYNELEGEEYRVEVRVNQEEKTIKIIDNGLGMTADEVKEYINNVAFSGASDFMNKYKDKASEDQIIGHFGLGFYSAFMVAHQVTISTLSYKEGAEAVSWSSSEGMEFEMGASDRTERGTEITLYLNEDSYEFANEYKAKEVIEKYCSFMPVPIFFVNENAKEEPEKDEPIDVDVDADGKAVPQEEKEPKAPKPINDPAPLWTKHPNDCTEEEYKDFYRKVFHDYREPLFWIHLNMDYPFNLKGILYFPKINLEYESLDGMIKLYSNQVFVADNIKEVIPEFLMLLKGVIDCPDLPLNVSRSALQNDGFVKKISDYITKKIADKLNGLFKVERENYEKYWDDISPFIKYGCVKDIKFKDKIKDSLIYKDLDGKYLTLDEYIAKCYPDGAPGEKSLEANKNAAPEDVKELVKTKIYYVSDEKQQSQYINMFREQGMDAILLTHGIDNPFMQQLEQDKETISFLRIDSDVSDSLRNEVSEEEAKSIEEQQKVLEELFRRVLGKEKLEVKVEKLKDVSVSSMVTLSEESRRMADMFKMYSMNMPGMDNDMFGTSEILVLNSDNALVKYVLNNKEGKKTELIAAQLYDLAMLSHTQLPPEAMTAFVKRSNEIMTMLSE